MHRLCRITGCTNPAVTRRTICHKHRHRIRHHGDPDFHTWTTADPADVELLIRNPRPTPGLTRLERVLVARGLTRLGLPADEIARIFDVTPRTVYRWRSKAPRQAA